MADKTTNLQLQKIDSTDYAGNFPTIYNNNLDVIDNIGGTTNRFIENVTSEQASDELIDLLKYGKVGDSYMLMGVRYDTEYQPDNIMPFPIHNPNTVTLRSSANSSAYYIKFGFQQPLRIIAEYDVTYHPYSFEDKTDHLIVLQTMGTVKWKVMDDTEEISSDGTITLTFNRNNMSNRGKHEVSVFVQKPSTFSYSMKWRFGLGELEYPTNVVVNTNIDSENSKLPTLIVNYKKHM